MIGGGSVAGAGLLGFGAWWLFGRKPQTVTPTPLPPAQTPPTPVWQVEQVQVVGIPAQYTGTVIQSVYSSSLVLLPMQLQDLHFAVYPTNIATMTKNAIFQAQILQHGTGQVILNLRQKEAPQSVLPGGTGSVHLYSQYSATALAALSLPTGAADLVISATDGTGRVLQTFTYPNALQFENATNIQGVGAGGGTGGGACPAKILAGPFWGVYGGAVRVGAPSPAQQALQQAQAAMAQLLQQGSACPLQVLRVTSTALRLPGYVVAQGNPTPAILQFAGPTMLPV